MRLFLFLFLLLITKLCFAGDIVYIVSEENIVVGKTNYVPDAGDLSSRNEIAIVSKEDISFNEAEYRNGKIIKHVETTAEKNAKKKDLDIAADLAAIAQAHRKDECEAAVVKGVSLKVVKCSDFEQ